MSLNKAQRERVGENCISAQIKNNNKKQVIVYTSGKDAGLAVKGALAAAYPSYKFYKAENRALNTTGQILFGIFTLGAGNAVQALSQTWKNFTVDTKSKDNAEKLVKEIDSCITEYGGYGAGSSDSFDYTSTDSGEDSAGAKDYTTYIIIGVAAAIIIALLLWNQKRK